MREETRLEGESAWGTVERLLIALTFGCFVLMALAIFRVSAKQLMNEGLRAQFLSLLAPAFVMAVVLVLCRRANEGGARRFVLVLFLTTLALKGTFAVLMDTQPVSDFEVIYNAAVYLARDGKPFTDQPYFVRWPYQSGPAVYLAALIRLFGANLTVIKLFNALWAALTSVMIYALAKRFASEGGARGAAVLYTLYPGTWVLVPVLTNQHLSELLIAVALYIYTVPAQEWKKRLGSAVAAGAVLALGNAIRPLAMVVLAAAGCTMVLEILRGSAGRAVLRFLLLAAVYVGVMSGLSGLVKVTGINKYGLSNSCPEWKFACGLNEATQGMYSEEDETLIFDSEDPRQTARELALERAKMPPARMLGLFGRKIEIMWGGYEAAEWMLTPNVVKQIDASGFPGGTQRLNRWGLRLSSGFYALSFLLAAAGGAAALKGCGRRKETAQLLALAALAYFGVHLFIEIQVRYRSLMYIVVFPLTALGLDALWKLWDRRRANGKKPQNV